MEKALFKVVKVDPDGSGMDFSNHLGMTVYNADRCCPRCSVIFGCFTIEEKERNFGPFIRGELEPLNEAAKLIHSEIEKWIESRRESLKVKKED